MFNGRNQFLAKVNDVNENHQSYQLSIEIEEDKLVLLTLGSQVTVDGCALTICAIDAQSITVELTKDNLRTTTLGSLQKGNTVCIDMPLKLGDDITVFMLSGQISTQAEICRIFTSEHNHQIWLKLDRIDLSKYLFEKSLIGLNGHVLSISEVLNDKFCVHLSMSQKLSTSLGQKRLGHKINVEFNSVTTVTVDTILRQLNSMSDLIKQNITQIAQDYMSRDKKAE
ncbi:hypothetical protein [Thorsellia anophelis]|uniref:Riboflavin synthase n=1 Tax=Thorsellia anophelis DSM 18579 TaxID=1123402 RepID=A0A1I0BLR8_9GAMM|nr:hypothetical protein [Thorsellia anophelis]SET07907.1 riboflavin synthase alpha chain [Thorsellia anophelis DSM 18579]